ncbi:DUF3618 domain-containing protein [Promicromonospora thailandica]|uniref:DUF3618 domain-containing protein n=1 Tax=Promicromonospora thailandica TaxID=765201 RepID=A0A9X2G7H4_9MICO|nr:DUF3618 domain-containing protein [Promicromonospora thailandica]MCP2266998.1 Protein of unknown function (DUF3618) [Promicromonospora thailandica]
MSTNDPDEIRADIERTRAELSHDVDTLGDKVHPGHAVRRQTDKVRSGMGRVKDRVMGTAHDTMDSAHGTSHDLADRGREAASSVAHGVGAAPQKVREQTQGNPLAVGLVAFGAGLALASLLPASRTERRAVAAVEEKAAPLVDDLKSTASEVAEGLKEPAREGAEAVRDAAKDAAQQVGEHGRETVSDLRPGSSGTA